MARGSSTSQRSVRENGSRAKRHPERLGTGLEQLEGRVVPSSFPSTTDGIHVIEDQLPGGLSAAMVRFVATHTDGTEKETLDLTNQFRAINPDFTVLHYQLGTGNSPFDYIINNQWTSDFGSVTPHEDWFAHQIDSGEPQSAADLLSGRVGNSLSWDQADISNPAWQQYTLGQVLQNMAATGSDGWFADSFTYGIGGGGYDGLIPVRYQGTNAANPASWPGGVTWTTQLGNWAQTIQTAFAQYNAANGTDYKFIPNLDARATSWEPDWYDDANGVPFIDGAFLEGFGQYTDTYDWTLSMNRGLDLTRNDKIVIMQPYPSADPGTDAGQQQVDFLLGTYLLLKGDQTYLNIFHGGGVQYYPQYQLDLGTPATPPPADVSGYLWNGVYRRDFQNGFVLVNPGSTTYTLDLGGSYQRVQGHGGGTTTDAQLDADGNYIGGSLTYQTVSGVTLAGGTAAVFLKSGTASPLAVATPAAAGPNPVAGTSAGLSVLGQENGTDAGLTYTWSAAGPAGVSFSANGTNAAKDATAAFTRAGTYVFTATISDGTQSVTSTVTVTVNQTLTSLLVSPPSATVYNGATQQFTATALDQFGVPLAAPPAVTWSIDAGGVGTIAGDGLYTAPTAGPGSATIRASSGTTSASAVVSVAAGNTATFVGSDSTTQGSWGGRYGADGYVLAGGPAAPPGYAAVAPAGQQDLTWAVSTTDPRALQQPGSAGRVAATWYSKTGFTVDLDLTDGQVHRVAAYFLDWDHRGRSERVDVIDAGTGAVLDTRTVSGFSGGRYLTWDLSGHVRLRVTRLGGASAVLSGLFFGGPAAAPTTTAAGQAESQSLATQLTRTYAAGADAGGAPTVNLYNPDGSARLTATPFPASFAGGVRVAVGDFNRDGVGDLAAGTGPGTAAEVKVLDGATGAVLADIRPFEGSFPGGVYVTAGDLTGDGLPDLVITPDEGGGPRVLVYDGQTFQQVASFFGIDDPNFRGGARAAVGDINGDGTPDLVVAAGFGGGPRVAFFDGTTVAAPGGPAKLFGDLFVFEQGLRNGVFVTAGDIDGDGFADLIIGGGPGGGPRVIALSGGDLTAGKGNGSAVLVNFFAGDPANRGGVRVAAKDLDEDANADLVVGSGSGAGSRTTGYLGKDFAGGGAPAGFGFDAFPGFAGGVFVG